jgi:hypothetical protein
MVVVSGILLGVIYALARVGLTLTTNDQEGDHVAAFRVERALSGYDSSGS